MKIHQLITRETWCQEKSQDGKKRCALAWLTRVYGGGKDFRKAFLKLREVIGFRPIVGWNDNQYTDYNAVYTAFKKADI
jgi:hypothetical protein